jgi:sugar phosphate permease
MKKIFYGWWIVVATSLIHFWGSGTFFYCFTAFFNPIVDEFSWSYGATALAFSLRSIEGGLASPVVGFAADRYGTRRLLFLGSILCGLGFILFSRINSLWTFYLVFVFLSIGGSFLYPIPGWTAVANWFVRKRGAALGILSSSIGVAGVLVYFVNWLIEVYGWRSTLVIIGVVMWIIGVPLSLVVRHRPEPYGLAPDGDRPSDSALDGSGASEKGRNWDPEGMPLFEALKTGAFWFIAATVTISGAALHAVAVHIMPSLISVGFDRQSASVIASLLVLVSVPGRLALGWLSNRVQQRYLLVWGLVLQAVGLLLLTRTTTLVHALVFVALFGSGYGGLLTLRLTIQAEYFGRSAFGAIQGTIKAIMMIGTIASPVLTGVVYDRFGSYGPAWLFMAVVMCATVPLALKARPPHIQRKG